MNSVCPEIETLSAWHDNEIEDIGVSEHVSACNKCQQTLTDFQRVDDVVVASGTLSETGKVRILSGCRDAIARSGGESIDKGIIHFPIWLKIAACILFIGAVGFWSRNGPVVQSSDSSVVSGTGPQKSPMQFVQSGNENGTEIASNSTSPKSELSEPLVPTLITLNPSLISSHQSSNNVSIVNDARSPMTSSSPNVVSVSFSEKGMDRNNSTHIAHDSGVINDFVRHVWIVEDPKTPLNVLKGEIAHDDVIDELIVEGQERYRFRLHITNNDLQRLVNNLNAAGCDLVSPDFPKPNNNPVNMVGKMVEYDVSFHKSGVTK